VSLAEIEMLWAIDHLLPRGGDEVEKKQWKNMGMARQTKSDRNLWLWESPYKVRTYLSFDCTHFLFFSFKKLSLHYLMSSFLYGIIVECILCIYK